MDIKTLPSGSSCLVDANIFIYHLAGLSPECTEFIARLTSESEELRSFTWSRTAAIRERYLRDRSPVGLGRLATNFARMESFPRHPVTSILTTPLRRDLRP